LAVTAAGAVLVLDSVGMQLLILRPGGAALERVVRLDVEEPASVTVEADERVAYVAHRDGVARVDLQTRAVARLTASDSVALAHRGRSGWPARALTAGRAGESGPRRIVRLDLNARGRAVVRETTLESSISAAGSIFVTFWGDELVYLADSSSRGNNGTAADAS